MFAIIIKSMAIIGFLLLIVFVLNAVCASQMRKGTRVGKWLIHILAFDEFPEDTQDYDIFK